MAIECGSCPKTFRTENGKRWHLENIHGQVRTSEPNSQVKTAELELIVENEISSQVLDRNSPLNVALDERLQAVTAIRREPAKVEDESNALAKYLADDGPAKSDPLAPYLRKWPAATPAKVVDKSCPLSATGKRCDHLEPARQHAALRSIGFPEVAIREQATPAKVVEMEGYFPGPVTGCLSHSHVESRELESSTSWTWPRPTEAEDMIIREVLEDMGYAV